MSCIKKIKSEEISGSTFRGREISLIGDITDYSFIVKVKSPFQGRITEIQGIKNADKVFFSFEAIKDLRNGKYIIEYWGDFGALGNEPFLLEELSIVSAENATNCANSDNLNFEIKIEEISIPVNITKAINNFSLNIENLTPEQIALLKGEKGDKGDKGEKGEKGDKGDAANVTAENIEFALGFVPQEKLNISDFVTYTGATKDVNIASNYFKTSKGFDFTYDENNYFNAIKVDNHYSVLEFQSKDESEDNFGSIDLLVSPEAGFNISIKDNNGLALNSFQINYHQINSIKPFLSDVGFKTPTGTANQALTANGGVFDLNTKADLENGKVPATQLPSYVDDVLEYANLASFPATGESGKIYIAIDTNLTYRWGGSSYVVMSSSLALGETSSTAYRGDRGKIAYDHSQVTHDKNLVGLGNVDNTSDANKPISLATQNALNLKADKGLNIKITTPSSWVTGTMSETEVLRIEIPANSISENSFLNMPILFINKIGTNGTLFIRGKLSTSPTMPSGTTDQLFQSNIIAATNQYAGLDRIFLIDSNMIKGFPYGIPFYSASGYASNPINSKPFDRTVTNYLYISILLGNSADQARLEGMQLTNS